MRTTIDLPDPLFRDAKAVAAHRGLSLKEFFTDAVRNFLLRSAQSQRMTSPPVNRRSHPIPARSNRELATLLAEEEDRKVR